MVSSSGFGIIPLSSFCEVSSSASVVCPTISPRVYLIPFPHNHPVSRSQSLRMIPKKSEKTKMLKFYLRLMSVSLERNLFFRKINSVSAALATDSVTSLAKWWNEKIQNRYPCTCFSFSSFTFRWDLVVLESNVLFSGSKTSRISLRTSKYLHFAGLLPFKSIEMLTVKVNSIKFIAGKKGRILISFLF